MPLRATASPLCAPTISFALALLLDPQRTGSALLGKQKVEDKGNRTISVNPAKSDLSTKGIGFAPSFLLGCHILIAGLV